MIDLKTKRNRLVAWTAAGCALLALVGCDQAASTPQAQTTPAANTVTGNTADTDAKTTPVETPAPQQAAPKPPQDNRTQADLRVERERELLENQGVVFSDDPDAQPRLMIRGDTTQHAGVIYSNKQPVQFVFNLYNGGTSDLIITRISSSCGCTVPKKDGLVDVAFPPGADLPPLEIAYTPKSTGDSSKAVTLFTNDPVSPIVRLKIGANMAALAAASPADIRPGELRAGRTHIVKFDVLAFDANAKITSITAPKMEGMLDFNVLEPVEISDEKSAYKVRIPVEIVFPKELGDRKISNTINIIVLATPPGESEAVESPLAARLVANLAGDLRFTRPFARVSYSEPGETYSFSSNLTSVSGSDFEITRVVAHDRRSQAEIELTVSYERVEEARVPTWRMSFDGQAPQTGSVTGEVTVYTSLVDEPPAKMTFSGMLTPKRTGQPAKPANGAAPSPGMNDRVRRSSPS